MKMILKRVNIYLVYSQVEKPVFTDKTERVHPQY